MEYTKGKNVISKFFKSALSIATFIVISILVFYAAAFVIKALFAIAVFGVLVWCTFKIVKKIKMSIYKISTKKNSSPKANIFNSDQDNSESVDINYEDSVIVDVDYEKVI
ncbi:MAG: hypothetical protein ACREVX_05985 [Clostridium sp.]|uniref:hypothetical protein n=1 Tax=Clostridium sp. TaxID=1506 RepID=UPI003D6D5D26